MPVSATQHRATTGTHQNKFSENNRRSSITHTSVINRTSQHVQRDQYDFPLTLTHAGNSPDVMPRSAEQLALRQSAALLGLQLLSQIRPDDNPVYAAFGNFVPDSGRDLIPSVSRNTPRSDNSDTVFRAMLSPVSVSFRPSVQQTPVPGKFFNGHYRVKYRTWLLEALCLHFDEKLPYIEAKRRLGIFKTTVCDLT